MKLITKLWPVNGLDEFEHLLPPPLEQRLTKLVLKAHPALQVSSGISTLGREGVLPAQVEQFLNVTCTITKTRSRQSLPSRATSSSRQFLSGWGKFEKALRVS